MSLVGGIIDNLAGLGIRLAAEGDELVVKGRREALNTELLAKIKTSKRPLLRELQRRSGRAGNTWHMDEHGRVVYSDGTIYAYTTTGGLILVQHPTKRMREPGTVENVLDCEDGTDHVVGTGAGCPRPWPPSGKRITDKGR
jgi:hypothetical protein